MRLAVLLLNVLLVMPGAVLAQSEPTPPPKPKVLFFDVNETLLDLASMRASVGEALGGREDLLPLWFSTMLHYSLVDSATGRYHGFGQIGVAALMMVAEGNGIEITPEAALTAIATPLRSLPAHPDVHEGLQALKDQGYTLVSLTNSSNAGVAAQFEHTGLTKYFERRLSIEDIKLYKPNLGAFQWAVEQMGIEPEEGARLFRPFVRGRHGRETAPLNATPTLFQDEDGEPLEFWHVMFETLEIEGHRG